MINFMNQPNQHMSFANGCLSLAEWFAAVFAKLQHRGVLDFDRAMWQFIYILIQVHRAATRFLSTAFLTTLPQPRLVYKDSVFHKQTNATWAREDPAFIITLTLFMLVSALAYGIAFSEPIVEFGFLLLEVVVIHLYLASAACATVAWALASSHLKSGAMSTHAMSGAKVKIKPALSPFVYNTFLVRLFVSLSLCLLQCSRALLAITIPWFIF